MSSMDPHDPSVFGPAGEDFDDAPGAKKDRRPLSARLLIDVWTRPRATMRRILNMDPAYLVVPLACAYGFRQTIDRAISRDLGDRMSMGAILGLALVFGSVGGIVGLYLFGWLWSWAGRKLGGVGDSTAVRAAIAWGGVPAVAGLAVWLALYAAIGPDLIMKATPNLDASPGLRGFLLGGLLVNFVLIAWSFVLALKCIGEAHRFSAWRALGATILGSLAFIVPIVAVLLGVAIALSALA